MKILIAGGAGFIGSHLSKRLLDMNHSVLVWDNLYTGNLQNISEIQSHPHFSFENIDIRNPGTFSGDAIINLACPASPPHYQKDPIYTWETSILGTYNLLKIAERAKTVFLHASTSEVYGDPHEHPQKETYWGNVNTVGLRSCYDEGKRAAETIIADFQRFKSLDARVFRIFNTYGPFMDPGDGRVVSNFCVQAISGKALTIYGSGNQTRSFCYVSDLVDGIIKMLTQSTWKEILPVNLGNPHEFTILELADLIFSELNIKKNIVFKALPADDPKQRKPDISRAHKLLNWEPRIQLKDGLKKTLEYFSNIHK